MHEIQIDHDAILQLAADAGLYPENIGGLDSQLYAALREIRDLIRRDPPEPEGQNKALWLADEPTRMPSRQYYYKDSRCKADNSDAPNCICWHDEGTGPRKAESTGARLRWRYAR